MALHDETIDERSLPGMLENFSLLREKALAYVQQTSGATWTDHNVHDPGITILEALCYALSDLGYRTNFPQQDLLTDEAGNLPAQAFYYPQEILPSHPVTINDFRKILIDLPLVKNAWITPLTSPESSVAPDYEPMYVDKKGGRLLLKKDIASLPASDQATILATAPVFITGLYAVHIQFEEQPLLGAIDSGEAFEGVFEKDFFGEIFYDINNWNELINSRSVLQTIADAYATNRESLSLKLLPSSRNKYNNKDGKLDERVLAEWYFDIDILVSDVVVFTWKEVLFQPYLENRKGISGKDLKDLLTKNNFAFFDTPFQKIQALAQAYASIEAVLHRHRNLAEDFLPGIAAIPTIDFRICADIDVDSKADIEQVQAQIFYRIEEYISPTIPFYSFEELAARGKAIEDVLEGPLLSHGFVLEEEMGENSFQDFCINLSDVINAIYETDGLLNCRNVSLFLTDDKGNVVTNDKWVVKVPAGYKPVLNKRKSKLIFYKNGLPLTANFRETIIKLGFLQANRITYKNAAVPLPVLHQTYRNLALHYSLANEFPETYKIGGNLPDEFLDKPELFASKQLEGYLLLFEQLIANFLKDLDQLKAGLSWAPVNHMRHQSTDNTWRRNYLLTGDNDNRWQDVVEPEEAFVRKRNEALDYLLARFGEDLHEMDNYFYLATDNLAINETEYYSHLISLKQQFLASYCSLSANRGAAVNLRADASYFHTPLSGYENRVSRLLGCELMKDNRRRGVADIDKGAKTERGYFHVLEHILLRIPLLSKEALVQLQAKGINPALLGICTDDDCTACGGFDPYSFTVSLVLPAWIPVYKDVQYRDFVERLIRKETPAGVLLRICWLTEEAMASFEAALDGWWAAKHAFHNSTTPDSTDLLLALLEKQNVLVQVLKAQRSEYFQATLHGCEDEGEENNTRVFLNKSFLG